MNKEKTVVILAAGMGSRFGSLKQLEPVGPWGQLIIDYSVYDAKQAGFTKVVFVIKEENYHDKYMNAAKKAVRNNEYYEFTIMAIANRDPFSGFSSDNAVHPWKQ